MNDDKPGRNGGPPGDIRADLEKKRGEWRAVRGKRLRRKTELMEKGLGKREIRKDGIYRDLEKKQEQLSKFIRHIEARMNRKTARDKKAGAEKE